MRRALSTLLLSCSFLVPAACGSSDEKPQAVAPAIGDLVQAFCDTAFRCCSAGEVAFFMGPYLTKDACAERLSRSTELAPTTLFGLVQLGGFRLEIPNVGALDRAAKEKRGSVDREAVDACLAYLDTLPCNEPVEEEEGCKPLPPPAEATPCDPRKLFVGRLQVGEPCTSGTDSLECAPGLLCRTSAGELGVKGECVVPGGLNDPCFTDSECGKNLYCSQLDGSCQRPRKEGESCVYADRREVSPPIETLLLRCEPHLNCDPISDVCVARCQRGAFCVTDEDCDEAQELSCVAGACDRLRAEGLPCAEDDDCVEGLMCSMDPADPELRTVCRTRLPLGSVCTGHDDCESEFCDPVALQCGAPVPAGSLCPSGEDAQCIRGDCNADNIYCTTDDMCPGSGTCDTTTFSCVPYCVELKPDGAICTTSLECLSEACISGFCRTLPLPTGQTCESDLQCESEFCGLEENRVCAELPLPLGAACLIADHCDSLVCFASGATTERTCASGLGEDEPCGGATQQPCNPKRFYCDTELDKPVCVPLHEAGERCKGDYQCRGNCVLNYGRMMCDPTPERDGAICGGTAAMSSESTD